MPWRLRSNKGLCFTHPKRANVGTQMELRSGRLMALAAAAGMAGEWAAVPDELEKMAQAKMRFAAMVGTEAKVNMRGQHPLAKWGRDKRKEKAKAKIAAASRRRNRK